MLQKNSLLVPGNREKLDECPELLLAHVTERFFVLLVSGVIEVIDDLPSLFRDARSNETAIDGAPLPRDQPGFLHSVEEPCRVGHPVEKPLAYLVPAESLWFRASQDPQHVVLSTRDSPRLEHLLEGVAQYVGSPDQVELGLLPQGPERLVLLELFL